LILGKNPGKLVAFVQNQRPAATLKNAIESPDHCAPETAKLRGFWALFVTQFQGAFSDNVLKNLVIFMILGLNVPLAEQHHIGELVGALFSLPFILFSMAGGFLADKLSKRTVVIGVKNFEIAVMLFATVALALKNLPMELGAVFGMGVHSAFFGPSKYGLLPELLPEKKLSWGNGLLEFGTFVAIILGTVAAAFMYGTFDGRQIWSGIILLALAFVGLTVSLSVTRVRAADPARKFRANFLGDLFAQLNLVRKDRPLALAFLGNTYFNFLGALLLLNLFFYGADVLHVGANEIGLLNVALALGIGVGSVAAGYLSGGKIEHGLVPLGAFGMSLFCVLLAASHLSVNTAFVWLALLGFTGGFFIVPVSAILQHRPDPAKKGEVLAAANLLSFVGIFFASGAYYLLADRAHLNPRAIFLFGGALTFAGAIFVLVLSPDSLVRAFLWLMTRTVYRVRVVGLENVPRRGGALLISNHVSFVDWLLVSAAADRPVRFLMGREYYDKPWVKPFVRVARVIPIPSGIRPREVVQALRQCGALIQNGDLVCVFAEGGITRTGQLQPFQRGFEKIMRGGNTPIIPAALNGVWGSIFSFAGGKFFWKRPQKIRRTVTVVFGQSLPSDATAEQVQQAVSELMQH
jgi:acyl-[acyl-carrier-protein]-phospholipid O-acyltransferase / long-chain-fatty-acid--[acyl-carrier-protein] ligase